VLFLVLAYRLRLGRAYHRQGRAKQRKESRKPAQPMEKIDAVFRHSGLPRSPWETYRQWQRRLSKEPELAEACSELDEILALHYQMRYRSRAPSAYEHQRLRKKVDHWLQRWSPVALKKQE
jgi:hypothetical protein